MPGLWGLAAGTGSAAQSRLQQSFVCAKLNTRRASLAPVSSRVVSMSISASRRGRWRAVVAPSLSSGAVGAQGSTAVGRPSLVPGQRLKCAPVSSRQPLGIASGEVWGSPPSQQGFPSSRSLRLLAPRLFRFPAPSSASGLAAVPVAAGWSHTPGWGRWSPLPVPGCFGPRSPRRCLPSPCGGALLPPPPSGQPCKCRKKPVPGAEGRGWAAPGARSGAAVPRAGARASGLQPVPRGWL